MRKLMAVLALVVVAQGCAAKGTAAVAAGSTRQATTPRSNVITAQELAEHPELMSVADAVRRLRPGWRAGTVFINNDPYVGASNDIPVRNVRELRYLTASEAQMKWGSKYREVIQVLTR